MGRGLESLLPGPRVVSSRPSQTVVARADRAFLTRSRPFGMTRICVEMLLPGVCLLRLKAPSCARDSRAARLSPHLFRARLFRFRRWRTVHGRRGILWSIWRLMISTRIPTRRGMGWTRRAWRNWRSRFGINGVVQPVVVRPAEKEGRYILILGQRRCLASKMAEKTTVPALVKRVSEQQAAEMTIVENLQREDLSPLEHAEAFKVLSQKFGLTQQQIGERVGLARESVSNYMRLLKLPERVLEYMAQKKLGFAEARELLKLEDVAMIQKAADDVVSKRMPFHQIEEMVMQLQGVLDPLPGQPGYGKKKSGARWIDPNVRSAQGELERLLGVRVRIKDRKGKGKIVIEYHTVDDYERVVGMLKSRG